MGEATGTWRAGSAYREQLRLEYMWTVKPEADLSFPGRALGTNRRQDASSCKCS